MMKIDEALQAATKKLQPVVERPRLEAEILLAHHLGCERSRLLLRDRERLERPEAFFALVERRRSYEPVEYITREVSFYAEEFFIAPGALIPRPETEILVDVAAKLIGQRGYRRVAEIGVGSGAVSVTLARLFPDLQIVATDISQEALAVAEENLRRFEVGDRITLKETSLLEGVDPSQVEMIVSNPPYVAEGCELEPNVADYEPSTALFAPGDGTVLLRRIVDLSGELGVSVVCEMGYDQRKPMEEYFRQKGIENYRFYRDLAGLDRGFIVDFG